MKVTLSRTEKLIIECTESELQSDLKFAKKVGNWKATHIDNKEIECFCIYCNKPLLESSEYIRDVEGESICIDCVEKCKMNDI